MSKHVFPDSLMKVVALIVLGGSLAGSNRTVCFLRVTLNIKIGYESSAVEEGSRGLVDIHDGTEFMKAKQLP